MTLVLNSRHFALPLLLVAMVIELGCALGGSTGSTTTSTPPPTCSGAAAGATTGTYVFAQQDNASKCMYNATLQERANSQSEAETCANGQKFANSTLVPIGNVRIIVLGVDKNQWDCFTSQTLNKSGSDAIACARATYCSNCTYEDITAQVVNPDGSINLTAEDAYCGH